MSFRLFLKNRFYDLVLKTNTITLKYFERIFLPLKKQEREGPEKVLSTFQEQNFSVRVLGVLFSSRSFLVLKKFTDKNILSLREVTNRFLLVVLNIFLLKSM